VKTIRTILALLLLAMPTLKAQFVYTISNGTISITACTNYPGALTIPNTIDGLPVTSIGSGAFFNNNLTSATIPSSVTNIGDGPFENCAYLTAITVYPNNPAYSSVQGVLFDKNQTTLIQFPGGLGGSYDIPDSVTNVASLAFVFNRNLTGVTIPNSVTSIGDDTFQFCFSLSRVMMGNGVITIGANAFNSCGLTNVTIPNSVSSIGDSAFYACNNLINVAIPNSVTSLGPSAFSVCSSLTSVTISSNVTSILDNTFAYDYNLTYVVFTGNAPSSVGLEAFYPESQVTIYYLPGTTGWSSTFNGFPALLWNPSITASPFIYGLRNYQFGFNITGTTNIAVVVEACTNLVNSNWIELQTNTLSEGSFHFSDSQWANFPYRFYRLRPP
jgi:BspA type Leucine rich repeat region (6 copies)